MDLLILKLYRKERFYDKGYRNYLNRIPFLFLDYLQSTVFYFCTVSWLFEIRFLFPEKQFRFLFGFSNQHIVFDF